MAVRRVVFNQKGGVGKTTITCNLAAMSAFHGKRVLIIDLDPQGNTTQYLMGPEVDSLEDTLAGFYQSTLGFSLWKKKTEDFIHETPFNNLYIMPSHPELEDLQVKLESRYKMFRLKEALGALKGYDVIYMDTPPALNFYSRSALIAANGCLIPFDCDDFSRKALYALMESIDEIREDHNKELKLEGIVVNHFQARANLPKRIVDELIDEGLPVLNSYLSTSVAIRESHQLSRPMVYFDARHKLTTEFNALYKELGG